MHPSGSRLRTFRSILMLLLCCSLSIACQKAKTVKPPQASGDFRKADALFDAGAFAQAARLYENLLGAGATMAGKDRALLRLALTYALAESGIRDEGRAAGYFRQLAETFPQSPYAAEAKLILALQAEVRRLQTDAGRLQTDVAKREERIRQLSDELEKLKQIDLQRRPSRPPK